MYAIRSYYDNTACSKDLVIPTTIDNKKVTTIADFAFVNTDKIIVSYYDSVSDYYTEDFLENYTGTKDQIDYYGSVLSSNITGRTCYTAADVEVSVDINYVVITSYSIHYTKLYELSKRLHHGL